MNDTEKRKIVPKITGIAYTGGKMNISGWKYPVVVDLDGLKINSGQQGQNGLPLLINHENRTGSRIGLIHAERNGDVLSIEGEITSETDEATNIVFQGKLGAAWQLSIGAEAKETENVLQGSRKINGKLQTAPFHHVKSSLLREVSVVAVGADPETELAVKASFHLTQGEDNMNETDYEKQDITAGNAKLQCESEVNSTQDDKNMTGCSADNNRLDAVTVALQTERKRITDIREICGTDFPDIESEAIHAGWSTDVVSGKVLKAMREKRPGSGFQILSARKPEGAERKNVMEAALCLRSGISADELEKSLGAKAVEYGCRELEMSLRNILTECLELDGLHGNYHSDNDRIRAAFSTVTLPGLLSNAANKKLMESFKAQPVAAKKLCSSADLSDFKETERFRLTDVGDLLPVAQDGEIKEGGLTEERAVNQLETYGKKFCLTRKMIINDDLGAFMKVPAAMGNRAARLIDQLFFRRLLANPEQSDGYALFHTAHHNLQTGADTELSSDSLSKAIGMFLDQTDADNQPINVEPYFLLVPTALRHKALELTRGTTMIMSGGTGTTLRPALNVLTEEDLHVVSSPYLANSNYPGASAKAWYLFGNPQTADTWEIGYLKGRHAPVVEHGDTDFSSLGMWFRVYFDVGVREQDFRGLVKSAGE